MPQFLIAAVVTVLTAVGVPAAVAPVVGAAIVYGTFAAGAVLASSLFSPKPPKPEDVQTSFRQSTPWRGALYGRGLLGGPWAFGGTKRGNFHKTIILASRRVTSFLGFYIDDKAVTLDVDGVVQTSPWVGDTDHVILKYRYGDATEVAYDELLTAFPDDYTEDHRCDGCASLYSFQHEQEPENFNKRFPNSINTQYRADCEGVAVYDPKDDEQDIDDDSTWTYSDNLPRVVMDYMWHRDGMRVPRGFLTTPLALAGWQDAVDDANEPIPLKDTGTEPRYRCWTYYYYNERPGDVVRRMMAAGAARFRPTPDGGMTIDVAKWREPTVTIDESMVIGFDGVGRGRDIMQTANTIRATYTSPDHMFQSTDADPWIDDADVSERGEISKDENFQCSPSHGQTRRLMKIAAARANPEWTGTFTLNRKGLIAFGEGTINFSYAPFGISGAFDVMDFNFLIGENGSIRGCQIAIQSTSESTFTWNAATEEGTAPPFEDLENERDSDIEDVTGFAVALESRQVAGQYLPYAILECDPPDAKVLQVQFRGRKDGDVVWQDIPVAKDEASAEFLMSQDGEEYEFQARYLATGGSASAWTASETLVSLADNVPPGIVTGLGVSVTNGVATVTLTAPNEPTTKLRSVRVYRAPAAATYPTNAVDVSGQINVAPNQAVTFVDDEYMTEASYKWHVVSENHSGVQSAAVSSSAYTAGYDTDAIAYFNAVSDQPVAARRAKFSELAKGLKADGVWSLTDGLWLWEDSESSGNALRDFRIPSHVATNSGATWSSAGFTGNASSAYVDLGKTPGGFGQSQNDATYGVGITGGTDAGNDSAPALGIINTPANPLFVPRTAAGGTRIRIGGTTNVNIGTVATIIHDFIVTRRGSTDLELYIDGSSAATSATASAALGTNNVVVFRNAATYSDFRISWVFVGRGLSDAQAAALRARLVTFFA